MDTSDIIDSALNQSGFGRTAIFNRHNLRQNLKAQAFLRTLQHIFVRRRESYP
jgi:hypothetical protein